MKSQKIVHTVRRFVFEEWGGTEAVVWQSALGLIQAGVPTAIAATAALDNVGAETRQGCPIERYPYLYPRLGLSAAQKLQLDKKGGDPYSISLFHQLLKNDCRIIHSHSMQRMAAMTRVAARIKKIPYVMSLHGGHYQVPKSEISDMVATTRGTLNYGRVLDAATRPDRALMDASGIICVGFEEYQSVKKRFPFKPVIYLPNGVNTQRYQNGNGAAFRQQHGIPQQDTVILCVSRIDPQKNQLALVDLLTRLNQQSGEERHHLVLVGPVTNASYARQLQQRVLVNDQEKHFTMVQGLQPESTELVNAYHAGDVFILPSVHEPFGIVALEAWSAGVPVIASRVGGLTHLIEHERTGLHFTPYKERSLLDTYQKLRANKELAQSMTLNARLEAEKRYSWSSFIDRLMAFYEDVESWHSSKHLNALPHSGASR
jgi:glycosyltransferase involved in cell wall biosynthesis